MANNIMLISILVLFITVIKTGRCIKCYSCASDLQAECDDPFDFKPIKYMECNVIEPTTTPVVIQSLSILPYDFTYCLKVRKGESFVRACTGNLMFCENHHAGMHRIKVDHCSICRTDFCNDAGSNIASRGLVGLQIVVSYLYCKKVNQW